MKLNIIPAVFRRTRSARTAEAIAKARGILRRVEQLETDSCWDFENTRQREVAYLQLEIDLLQGNYLTAAGLKYVEEMIGYSEEFIADAERLDAEEEQP
jgi:hypothetical protein